MGRARPPHRCPGTAPHRALERQPRDAAGRALGPRVAVRLGDHAAPRVPSARCRNVRLSPRTRDKDIIRLRSAKSARCVAGTDAGQPLTLLGRPARLSRSSSSPDSAPRPGRAGPGTARAAARRAPTASSDSSSEVCPSSSRRTICSSSCPRLLEGQSRRSLTSPPRPVAASRPCDSRTPIRCAGRDRVRRRHHVPVRVLHDRVPAVERRRRPQQPQPVEGVADPCPLPLQPRTGQRSRPSRISSSDSRRAAIQLRGSAKAGRDASIASDSRQRWARVSQRPPGARRTDRSSVGRDRRVIGHHQLVPPGWACRLACRRHVVDDRRVLLVPDRRHHRRSAQRHRPHQPLVRERQQILEAAAAARQHDHVHLGVAGRAAPAPPGSAAPRPAPCTAASSTRNRAGG